MLSSGGTDRQMDRWTDGTLSFAFAPPDMRELKKPVHPMSASVCHPWAFAELQNRVARLSQPSLDHGHRVVRDSVPKVPLSPASPSRVCPLIPAVSTTEPVGSIKTKRQPWPVRLSG